jgi:hypothetical protein
MKTAPDSLHKFDNLSFDDFKRLSQDESLSPREKVGFPDAYREGKEGLILADMRSKLSNMDEGEQVIADIGPGCSELPHLLIDFCAQKKHTLLLFDSQEMLNHLPDEDFIVKVPGYYPEAGREVLRSYREKVDVLLAYSLLHYVFREGNLYRFIDESLALLAHEGQMLIGDIPNVSKRKRFFSSPQGVEFHKTFMQTDEPPSADFNTIEPGSIDDAVLLSILMRCRRSGFDAYLLPQPTALPMANRREDLLIQRP